ALLLQSLRCFKALLETDRKVSTGPRGWRENYQVWTQQSHSPGKPAPATTICGLSGLRRGSSLLYGSASTIIFLPLKLRKDLRAQVYRCKSGQALCET